MVQIFNLASERVRLSLPIDSCWQGSLDVILVRVARQPGLSVCFAAGGWTLAVKGAEDLPELGKEVVRVRGQADYPLGSHWSDEFFVRHFGTASAGS